MSLYTPSPGLLKAARWFSRIMYLMMGIATVAAVGYAYEKDNRNDELLAQVKGLKQQLRDATDERDALQARLAAVEGHPSPGVFADPDDVNALRNDNATLVARNRDLQAKLEAMTARVLTAGSASGEARGEMDTLRGDVKLLTRKLEIVRGENERLDAENQVLRGGVVMLQTPSGMEKGEAAQNRLSCAWDALVAAPGDAAKRMAVADILMAMEDEACITWLGDHRGELPASAVVLLIDATRPQGGEALVDELAGECTDAALAQSAVDALRNFRTQRAHDALFRIAAMASIETVTRVDAAVTLGVAGDSRAPALAESLFCSLKQGDELRLLLLRLPAAGRSSAMLGVARMALVDERATEKECEEAKQAFRALGSHGLTILRELRGAGTAALPQARAAVVASLITEIEKAETTAMSSGR